MPLLKTQPTPSLIQVSCVVCGSSESELFKEKLGYQVVRCQRCTLLYVNPRPSPETLNEIYNRPESNIYNGAFAPAIELEENTFRKILSRLKKVVPRGKILEIGCGNADLLKLAKKEGYEVEGCDLVDQTACNQSANFTIHEKPLRDLKLKPSQFDLIIVRNTFEHYFSPQLEIEEVYRLLKPGGVLYLKVPNAQFEQGLLCRLAFQVEDLFAPPIHLNHFSPKTLKAFLKTSGFDFLSWQVEIPSKDQSVLKNFARKTAYGFCLLSAKIPTQPLGSGVTLACFSRKKTT